MFLFLFNNIEKRADFHKGEKYYWEQTLLYIYHLTDTDPITAFNNLCQWNYFDLIFIKNIKFSENELFYIFRIFANIFFENSNIIQVKLNINLSVTQKI